MKLLAVLSLYLVFSSTSALAIGGKGPLDRRDEDQVVNKRSVVQDKVGIEEHLGEQVDLDLVFTNELGQALPLKTYFTDKPVFLMLIYYECPTLCSLHLNALMETLKAFEWTVGNEFEFVAVSIDPDESSLLAKKKKSAYLDLYGKPETADGWHFLTGSEENIKKLASQIGFKYAWDPREQQWAHAAASYILTPQGKISYYHYGIAIEPKVLRLSLVEAGDSKIGTIVDRMVLFCMQYDPTKKTYAFYAFNIMRVAGFITILILAFYIFRFWRKENNKGKTV